MTEDSVYEIEKEIGRGKQKRVRNKLSENTKSNEEIMRSKPKIICNAF